MCNIVEIRLGKNDDEEAVQSQNRENDKMKKEPIKESTHLLKLYLRMRTLR